MTHPAYTSQVSSRPPSGLLFALGSTLPAPSFAAIPLRPR